MHAFNNDSLDKKANDSQWNLSTGLIAFTLILFIVAIILTVTAASKSFEYLFADGEGLNSTQVSIVQEAEALRQEAQKISHNLFALNHDFDKKHRETFMRLHELKADIRISKEHLPK